MSAPDETAVLSAVRSFLETRASLDPWRSRAKTGAILVAFSGGPDSTALLWALTRAAFQLGDKRPRIVAAHLDHGLDAESGQRAEAAMALAGRLGLPDADIRFGSLSPPSDDDPTQAQDGIEDWARERRYEWLVRVARDESADVVLTGHHADDQAETVALRLLYGTGLRGLAGVRPERELGPGVRLARPLLVVRRRDIDAALCVAQRDLPDLVPIQDPTNAEIRQPRALVRHHLLPLLESESPGATRAMIRVAGAAWRAHRKIDPWLDQRLALRETGEERFSFFQPPSRAVSLQAFLDLPDDLRRHALARLHARLGHSRPPSESAVAELIRQLDVHASRDDTEVGVDCGRGLRWFVRRGSPPALVLERRIPLKPFTYTFDTPGAAHVPEIFLSLRCSPHQPNQPQPWMFRGEVLRAGLSLPADARPVATVRCRRPGDHLHPLGSSGSRKLKDLLIDRKVPRTVRDRLPLLFLDGILAWVPGVTVDERFRLDTPGECNEGRRVWSTQINRWSRTS